MLLSLGLLALEPALMHARLDITRVGVWRKHVNVRSELRVGTLIHTIANTNGQH